MGELQRVNIAWPFLMEEFRWRFWRFSLDFTLSFQVSIKEVVKRKSK